MKKGEDKISYTYISEQDYLKEFSIAKLEDATKIALDTRKFEIELYWKRATYFWAFMIAIYSAYFLIATRQSNPEAFLLSIIAILGVLFSFGWYLANRGSKYWQENWEAHIGVLITKHSGPIFKYKLKPEHKFSDFIDNYPISVSRINQILSIINFIVWFILFFRSIFLYKEFEPLNNYISKTVTFRIQDETHLILFLCFKILLITSILIYILCKIYKYSKNILANNMEAHLSESNNDKAFIIEDLHKYTQIQEEKENNGNSNDKTITVTASHIEGIGLLFLLIAFGWQCFSSDLIRINDSPYYIDQKLDHIWNAIYDNHTKSTRYKGDAYIYLNYDLINNNWPSSEKIEKENNKLTKQIKTTSTINIIFYILGSILIITSKLTPQINKIFYLKFFKHLIYKQ